MRPQAAAPTSPKEGMMYLKEDTSVPAENVPIDGETILFLNAGSTYNMLIDAYKKGSAVQNTSRALTGMWLKAEELLTF